MLEPLVYFPLSVFDRKSGERSDARTCGRPTVAQIIGAPKNVLSRKANDRAMARSPWVWVGLSATLLLAVALAFFALRNFSESDSNLGPLLEEKFESGGETHRALVPNLNPTWMRRGPAAGTGERTFEKWVDSQGESAEMLKGWLKNVPEDRRDEYARWIQTTSRQDRKDFFPIRTMGRSLLSSRRTASTE